MGWHGVATAPPGQQDAIFLPPLRIFLQFFIVVFCCFIFVAMERSPKTLTEINVGLCSLQENSVFSCIQFIHLIVIT